MNIWTIQSDSDDDDEFPYEEDRFDDTDYETDDYTYIDLAFFPEDDDIEDIHFICPNCGALVEDGFQCDDCGMITPPPKYLEVF